jgi:hypothetical protein
MPKRDRGLERAWRRRVKERDASGLTVREFCEAEGLAESAYYFWRRELQRRNAEQCGGREAQNGRTRAVNVSGENPVAARHLRSSAPAKPRFVPIVVDDSSSERVPLSANFVALRASAIELVHPGGVVVRVPADVDAAALRRILGVLDGCAALPERSAEVR